MLQKLCSGRWLKFSIIFGIIAFLIMKPASPPTKMEISTTPTEYNPCCEFPCEHLGICMNYPNNTFSCDCTGTGYHGLRCHEPSFLQSIKDRIRPSQETLHDILTGYTWVWKILNNIPSVHRQLMKYVYLSRGDMIDSPAKYESEHSFTTLDAYYNHSFYARTLPPVPLECPTPMGVKGPTQLPNTTELFHRIFRRRKFIPDKTNSNILFQYYAQHFTHQFFRTDYKNGYLTKGNGGGLGIEVHLRNFRRYFPPDKFSQPELLVDVSNIYGLTREIQDGLRSKVDGKLITQTLNGEDFPPLLRDVKGIKMDYPPNVPIPEDGKFALGHPFFALLPGLFVYSTIWVREHNRVCDILKAEHPHWSDDQLYHTAKLIITGEVIKITIEDYVQHLSQYKVRIAFDPEAIHGTRFQFHNKIHSEFNHLYHWHPLVPDGITINDTTYSLMDMAFTNTAVFKHGLDNFIDALATSRAGQLTVRNHPAVVEPIFVKALANARGMRLPPFNQYRKRFNLKPYKTFEELTGETEIAQELRELYGDVDAVEFYVGLLAEEPGPSLTPLSMVNIGGPYSVKGLIANPICSPGWWKPSTFGGDVGFNIIKSASLKNLFCNNMKTPCKHISFLVPEGTE